MPAPGDKRGTTPTVPSAMGMPWPLGQDLSSGSGLPLGFRGLKFYIVPGLVEMEHPNERGHECSMKVSLLGNCFVSDLSLVRPLVRVSCPSRHAGFQMVPALGVPGTYLW